MVQFSINTHYVGDGPLDVPQNHVHSKRGVVGAAPYLFVLFFPKGPLCQFDIMLRTALVAFDLLRRNFLDDFGRAAKNHRAVGGVHLASNQRSRTHDAIAADDRTIQNNRTHSHQGVIPDGAAVDNGAMTDGAAFADGGFLVKDAFFLNIRILADGDFAVYYL